MMTLYPTYIIQKPEELDSEAELDGQENFQDGITVTAAGQYKDTLGDTMYAKNQDKHNSHYASK